MPKLTEHCIAELETLEAAKLRRVMRAGVVEGVMLVEGGVRYVNFAANDYLGLREHPAVIAAGQEALAAYGAGAGASRLVTGNHPLYAPLEEALAAMKGAEAALVFGSGYLTNLGVIPALMKKGDVIFADKLVHACIIDAAQLSGAKLVRFRHNDMAHLEALLKEQRYTSPPRGEDGRGAPLAPSSESTNHGASSPPPQPSPYGGGGNALIVTDHVFSMDGDVAPLAEIAALAKQYDAWTMADDAHGLGLIPSPVGGGSAFPVCNAEAEDNDPSPQPSPACGRGSIDIWMGTLSKAAGGYGGYVVARRAVVDYLVTSARSFVFSTGLPPAVCASALAALEIMQAEPERGARALAYARRVTEALGLPLAQSAIVPVILGTPEAALAAAEKLKARGMIAVAIRPPTVPPGTARLRLAFSAAHTDAQVDALIAALREIV